MAQTKTLRTLALVMLAILGLACDYHLTVDNPTSPTPTNSPAPVAGDVIEFRVTGDATPVLVRVNNGLDGLTQTATVLPYTHTITLTNRSNVFLSLEARSQGFGFLHAAIFVNGVIFREASQSALGPIVSVSGTYRRP